MIYHSPFFPLFDYTVSEWDVIKKTLASPATPRALMPGAVEKACYHLRNSACLYKLSEKRPKTKTRNEVEIWRKVAALTSDLRSYCLQELPYELAAEHSEALDDLFMTALSRSADELEKQSKIK
jgi:hypothetical protein